MLVLSRFLCLIGRHRRSRGHARRAGNGFTSRCRRCGIAMTKAEGGRWEVTGANDAAPAAAPHDEPAARRRFRLWPFGAIRRDRPA